jgi:hypothetical protein
MGSSSSYLKIKQNDYVVTFIYPKSTGQYVQQTFSCHPDNKFKTKKNQDYNYYYNHSGAYHFFDGDWDRLHQILDNFDPKITSVTYLVSRLEVECDLQKYKSFWEKVSEWKDFVVSIPTSTLEYVWYGAKKMIGYDNVEVKQITNY